MSRISLKIGHINKILENTPDFQVLEILVENETRIARLYKRFCVQALPGETVIVNQVARDLKLGSGGEDFVVSNLSKPAFNNNGGGHIMKLRYTPYQFAIPSIEEFGDYKEAEKNFSTLTPMKTAVGELHSMVAPLAYSVKQNKPDTKIIYIMTDAAALPLELSKTIKKLKREKVIESSITIGNAFGGDYEAVNLYSALITARMLLDGDLAIITMGPGIVGTATTMGFSGMEQVENLEVISKLGGRGILIPRISFAETRLRHLGISHHTKRILNFLSTPVDLPLPVLTEKKNMASLLNEFESLKKNTRENHRFLWLYPGGALDFYRRINHPFMTMGRGLEDDPDFFEALGAVSKWLLKC